TRDAEADELDEEQLPDLDADENDGEGESLVGDLLTTSVADVALPPMDATPWRLLDGAGAPVPCSAVAVHDGRVAAAGELVLVVDEGAHAARRASFGSGSNMVAFLDGAIVCATRRGQLLVSDDAANATAVTSWRPRPIGAVCASSGRLWLLSDGSLWRLTRPS